MLILFPFVIQSGEEYLDKMVALVVGVLGTTMQLFLVVILIYISICCVRAPFSLHLVSMCGLLLLLLANGPLNWDEVVSSLWF